jgi:hypothetical protein
VVVEGEDVAGAHISINAIMLPNTDGMELPSKLLDKYLCARRTRRAEQEGERQKLAGRGSD